MPHKQTSTVTDTCFLINVDTMALLKAAPTLEQAEQWRILLAPKANYFVAGSLDLNEHLGVFRYAQLKRFSVNLELKNIRKSNGELLQAVATHLNSVEVDATTLADLQKQTGITEIVDGVVDHADHVEEAPRKQSPIVRPSRGVTLQCWELYDALKETTPIVRADYLKQAIDQGVNKSTASVQFGKWKTYLAKLHA